MEGYFDPDRLAALLQAAIDWHLLNVANLWDPVEVRREVRPAES